MDGGLEPEKLRAAPATEAQRQGPDPLFTGDSGVGDDMMSSGNLLSSTSLTACSYQQKELQFLSVMSSVGALMAASILDVATDRVASQAVMQGLKGTSGVHSMQ